MRNFQRSLSPHPPNPTYCLSLQGRLFFKITYYGGMAQKKGQGSHRLWIQLFILQGPRRVLRPPAFHSLKSSCSFKDDQTFKDDQNPLGKPFLRPWPTKGFQNSFVPHKIWLFFWQSNYVVKILKIFIQHFSSFILRAAADINLPY